MSRVLVIGATGRIGSRVARRLRAEGHIVSGLARTEAAATTQDMAGIVTIRGDLDDIGSVTGAAQDFDATIFAAQLHMDAEHKAVAALLDAVAGTGHRFIFTSGTGVFAQRTAGSWGDDCYADDEKPTFSELLLRRVDTERLVRAAHTRGIDGIVVRPPMVWGDGAHNIVAWMLESHRKTGAVCFVGEGINSYTSVHVDDLADVYATALTRGVPAAVYHATSGEIPNRVIAEILARRLGCPTRSVSVDEGISIWGKFATLVVLSASSRSRSPRARADLNWAPHRTDLIGTLIQGGS